MATEVVWEGTTDNSCGTASNWSDGSVPEASDNVQIPAGSPDITSGLDQSAIALGSVWISSGYTGQIGDISSPYQPEYLQLDCDLFRCDGACTAYVKFVHSSGTTPAIVSNSASPNTGKYAVNLCSSGNINLDIRGGYVGLAYFISDTLAAVDLTVSAGVVHIGKNSTSSDVNITGGIVDMYGDQSSATGWTIENGTVNLREWKAPYAINMYNGILNADHWSTSPSAINVYGGQCVLDNGVDRTLTSLKVDGGTVSLDPGIVTVSTLNVPGQRRSISAI